MTVLPKPRFSSRCLQPGICILQVFSPSAPAAQVDAAEVHFKRALLTRQFGMNLNLRVSSLSPGDGVAMLVGQILAAIFPACLECRVLIL